LRGVHADAEEKEREEHQQQIFPLFSALVSLPPWRFGLA
jgi:aminopeptidase C